MDDGLLPPVGGVVKVGPRVPLTEEMREFFDGLRLQMERATGVDLWRWPDGWRGWPASVVVTPRLDDALDRLQARRAWIAAARRRAADAWAVLTGQVSIDEDDDW